MAWIFRPDLYTCGIASIANAGGAASAPIRGAYDNRNLVSFSVLMFLPVDISGTFMAPGMAQMLIKIIG